MPGARFSSVSETLTERENVDGPVTVRTFVAPAGKPTIVIARDPVFGPEGESLHATISDARASSAARGDVSFPRLVENMRRINIATLGSQGQHSGNPLGATPGAIVVLCVRPGDPSGASHLTRCTHFNL